MQEDSSARAPSAWLSAVLVGLLCLVWGSTWLVIKQGLRDLPPFTSAGARFVVASVAMIAAAPKLSRIEGGAPPPWWLAATMGSLNFAGSYGIVYWTETRLPSGLVSLLWAVFPLLMAISGHFFLQGERLSTRHTFGFVAGFSGVALLFLTDVRASTADALPVAAVLMVSPSISAVGTTLVKRHGKQVSASLLNRDAMIIGAVLLCALALWRERALPIRWTTAAIASIGYLALIGTCLTFGLLFWLMRHVAASRLSLIAFITPAIALTLGWLFAGEPVHAHTLLGASLVVVGVALVVRR
jgi:drug/metabolite transporter (DMT)-like permease